MDFRTLVALPECLFSSILTEWLILNDVGRLDAAFCSRGLREKFTKVAYSDSTVYRFDIDQYLDNTSYSAVVCWIADRGARLDSFDLRNGTIEDASRIKVLQCSGFSLRYINCVGDDGPILNQVVHSCKQVLRLHLSNFGVDAADEWLPALTAALQNLRHLIMHRVLISPCPLAESFKNCKKLTQLNICCCSSDLPLEVAQPELQILTVHGDAKVSSPLLSALTQNSPKLRTAEILGAAKTHLTDEAVRALLQGCPLLQETDVEDARDLGQELRVELARRCNFTVLNLADWYSSSDALVREVIKVSPSVTNLTCDDCDWLTDAVLEVCAKHCPLVEALRIDPCEVTVGGLVRAVKHWFHLSALDVGITGIGEKAMRGLARNCPGLMEVTLPTDVTDSALEVLAQGCPKLTKVNVSYSEVSDAGVEALAKHCSELQDLNMCGCDNLTLEGVRTVVRLCRKLKYFCLDASFRDLELPPLFVPAQRGINPEEEYGYGFSATSDAEEGEEEGEEG